MIGELARHVWQSTFFAVAAGLLTVAFRKNRAKVRYWLWLSTSLKFFLPFALLINLGSDLKIWAPAARQIATPAVSYAIGQFSQPFFTEPLPPTPAAPVTFDWTPAIIGVWLCGFLTIALIRFRSWLRIRSAVRGARASALPPGFCAANVDIRASAGLLEPGVVGLLRPILLLPEGITERLTPSELETVLAHELCHIQRRDNLGAAIHMAVETLFWFHPLVWWIGARLVEERERACDEEVLRLGNQPDVYADAILNVCKLYIESPLACVSGVSGASIKRRIEAIMLNRTAIRLNIVQKAALTVAALATLAVPVIVGVLTAPATRAQSASTARPKFEVASIRRCTPEDMPAGGGRGGGRGSGATPSAGNAEFFRTLCYPMARLIRMAYIQYAGGNALPQDLMLKDQPLQGGPDWIDSDSDRYTVEAKPASPQTRAMMNGPMLQTLLEERFKLKIHRESKEIPIYALVLAKGDPRLQHTKEGGCTPGDSDGRPAPVVPGQPLPCGYVDGDETGVKFVGVPVASLLHFLPLRRPIVDKTGLTGLFNYHLDVVVGPPNIAPPGLDDPAYADTIATVTSALDKLGLKIEPAKGNAEFIVIDHVERPSEN